MRMLGRKLRKPSKDSGEFDEHWWCYGLGWARCFRLSPRNALGLIALCATVCALVLYDMAPTYSMCSFKDAPPGSLLLPLGPGLSMDEMKAWRGNVNVDANNQPNGRLAKVTDTLLVVTTCNHIDVTMRMVESLEQTEDDYDLLFVDDMSSDGTPEFLAQRGYRVLSSLEPSGVTKMWNTAYALAKEAGYRYVILANNDLLIPDGAIDSLRRAGTCGYDVVGPMTTKDGAGHNPSQDLERVYGTTMALKQHISEPANAQNIQRMLASHPDRLIVSRRSRKRALFNGFFFQLNMQTIPKFEFAPNQLFDPSNVVIGQEDDLGKRGGPQLRSMVYYNAFIFHFKSITVGYAKSQKKDRIKQAGKNDPRNDLNFYHRLRRDGPTAAQERASSVEMVSKLLHSKHITVQSDALGCVATTKVLFVLPDFSTIPADEAQPMQDAVTELSEALHARAGWATETVLEYSEQALSLHGVDILVVLSSSYDLHKARGRKSTLLRVAWILDGEAQWAKRPWMRGYDIVLAGDEEIRDVLQRSRADWDIGDDVSRTGCFVRCPRISDRYFRGRTPSQTNATMHTGPTQVQKFQPFSASQAPAVSPIPAGPQAGADAPAGSAAGEGGVPDGEGGAPAGEGAAREGTKADFDFVIAAEWPSGLDPSSTADLRGAVVNSALRDKEVLGTLRTISAPFASNDDMAAIVKRGRVIVVHDHGCSLFGAMRSRYKDLVSLALRSGRMVTTNCAAWAQAVYGPELATYSEEAGSLAATLAGLLDGSTSETSEAPGSFARVAEPVKGGLVERAREVERVAKRALDFREILRDYGVDQPRACSAGEESTSGIPAPKYTVCVGVRAFRRHINSLETTVMSLLHQEEKNSRVQFKVLLMSTDARDLNPDKRDAGAMAFRATLEQVRDDVNYWSGYSAVDIYEGSVTMPLPFFFAYDITESVRQHLLNHGSCDYIMFTNGDNVYSDKLVGTVLPEMRRKTDIIGFDFRTHHRDGDIVRICPRRGELDVGAVMYRADALRRAGTSFLPEAIQTRSLFARDYFFHSGVRRGLNLDQRFDCKPYIRINAQGITEEEWQDVHRQSGDGSEAYLHKVLFLHR